MVAAVTTEPSFGAEPPRLLFRGNYKRWFDVTDDGRFVMITVPEAEEGDAAGRDDESSGRRLVVVVNWVEELKERLGAMN